MGADYSLVDITSLTINGSVITGVWGERGREVWTLHADTMHDCMVSCFPPIDRTLSSLCKVAVCRAVKLEFQLQ